MNLTAQEIWYRLEDIPVNDDGEIEVKFDIPTSYGALSFGAGTDRQDIWHWIENKFNISVTTLGYPD